MAQALELAQPFVQRLKVGARRQVGRRQRGLRKFRELPVRHAHLVDLAFDPAPGPWGL